MRVAQHCVGRIRHQASKRGAVSQRDIARLRHGTTLSDVNEVRNIERRSRGRRKSGTIHRARLVHSKFHIHGCSRRAHDGRWEGKLRVQYLVRVLESHDATRTRILLTVLLTRVGQEVRPGAGFGVDANLFAIIANDGVSVALKHTPTDAVAIEFRFTTATQRGNKCLHPERIRASRSLEFNPACDIVKHGVVRVQTRKLDVFKGQQELLVRESGPRWTSAFVVFGAIVERVESQRIGDLFMLGQITAVLNVSA